MTPALKEWSAAVHALLDGRQTVLLRKGGIGEKRPSRRVGVAGGQHGRNGGGHRWGCDARGGRGSVCGRSAGPGSSRDRQFRLCGGWQR